MYQFSSGCKTCSWQPLGIDGVEFKVIFDDPVSGKRTVLTKLLPGAVIPRHFHSHADETVFVIEGDFVEEGIVYGAGAYFVGKANTTHGPHKSVNGCTVLTHWNGGAVDFVEA